MKADAFLDCIGLICPMPVMKTSQKMKQLRPGQILEIKADDEGIRNDMPAWCSTTGNEFLGIEEEGDIIKLYVRKKT